MTLLIRGQAPPGVRLVVEVEGSQEGLKAPAHFGGQFSIVVL